MQESVQAKHAIAHECCSDGGTTRDYHITLALAMGADFVMIGRYFAGFEEAPGRNRIARVTAVSAVTLHEGGAHDVMVKETRTALEDE